MGEKAANGAPKALEKFRLTSHDKGLIEAAARLYGGDVQPWASPDGAQWQVYVTADELAIFMSPIPPTQHYEFWTKGGCQRRCDGITCTLARDKDFIDVPCVCENEELPDKDACKLTTRLSVWLPQLPGLGAWRLESHGYYAAVELPPAAELLIQQTKAGMLIPAFLAIERRRVVRHGETKSFVVPVIRLKESLSNALQGKTEGGIQLSQLPGAPALGGIPGAPALGPRGGDEADLAEANDLSDDGPVLDERTADMLASDMEIDGKARIVFLALRPGPDDATVRGVLQSLKDAGQSLNMLMLNAANKGQTTWAKFIAGNPVQESIL
jgi:hypothetical protein